MRKYICEKTTTTVVLVNCFFFNFDVLVDISPLKQTELDLGEFEFGI